MKYCSSEARKIVEHLQGMRITLPDQHMFDVELAVGSFYSGHIISVFSQILDDTEPKLNKARDKGWAYFNKPVWNMLTKRYAAHRAPQAVVDKEMMEKSASVYRVVTDTILVADFNMSELGLLLNDIPRLIVSMDDLANAGAACRKSGNRSIYYLHGIVKRESQTRQGKAREIQEQYDASPGWTPPPDFEQLDPGDRAGAMLDWRAKLNDIDINRALRKYAANQKR